MPIAFRLTGFSGRVPRRDKRLLDDNQAQVAYNVRLSSGALEPIQAPRVVNTPEGIPQAPILTLYRLTEGANVYWLTWPRVVSMVRGPIAGDTTTRLYYTGDGEPRVTNLALAQAGGPPYPASFYVLGIPAPLTAPTVTPSGGSGAAATRSYLYTFVSRTGALEEEGPPSPASAVTNGKEDDTWALTGIETAPPNSGGITHVTYMGQVVTITSDVTPRVRAGETMTVTDVTTVDEVNGEWVVLSVDEILKTITFGVVGTPSGTYNNTIDTTDAWARVAPHNTSGMVKRIYRTATGASGWTEYHYVDEIPAAQTTYDDTLPTVIVSQNAVLASDDWLAPPADMHAITALPNGMMVGISGNEVCFSEPYRPHAWPFEYRRTMAYWGIGIGTFGTNVVVVTQGCPYLFAAQHPDSLSETVIQSEAYVGLGSRGIVSSPNGVYFPVREGLANIGPGGHQIVTREHFTEREWAALNPASFTAAWHQNRYLAAYTLADGSSGALLILDAGPPPAVTVANQPLTALFVDETDGQLYAALNNRVVAWEGDLGKRMTLDWLSKEFVFPAPANLGAAKVEYLAATSPEQAAQEQAAHDAGVAANAALLAAGTQKGALNDNAFDLMAINGSRLDEPPRASEYQLQFTLYADGVPRHTQTVTSARVFRLPAGYKADTAEIRITSNTSVYAVLVGETPDSLRSL